MDKFQPDHPDYTSVQGALEAMRDVALLVNERKRRMECLEKIASWQITVEGWEVRRYLQVLLPYSLMLNRCSWKKLELIFRQCNVRNMLSLVCQNAMHNRLIEYVCDILVSSDINNSCLYQGTGTPWGQFTADLPRRSYQRSWWILAKGSYPIPLWSSACVLQAGPPQAEHLCLQRETQSR